MAIKNDKKNIIFLINFFKNSLTEQKVCEFEYLQLLDKLLCWAQCCGISWTPQRNKQIYENHYKYN